MPTATSLQGRGPFTGYGPGAANLPNWFLNGQGSVAAPSDAATDPCRRRLGPGKHRRPTVGAVGVDGGGARDPSGRVHAADHRGRGRPEIGCSGNLFSNMGLAGAAGGAVGSTAGVGRGDQRTRPTPRQSPKPPQQPPNEVVTAIATELQELASRAQSLLAKLADSGLVTTEEVIEQKRRFLG